MDDYFTLKPSYAMTHLRHAPWGKETFGGRPTRRGETDDMVNTEDSKQ